MKKSVDRIQLNNIAAIYEFSVSPINHIAIIADEHTVYGCGYASDFIKARRKAIKDAIEKGHRQWIEPQYVLKVSYQHIVKGNIVSEFDAIVSEYRAKKLCRIFVYKIDKLLECPLMEKVTETYSTEDEYEYFEAELIPADKLSDDELIKVLAGEDIPVNDER